MNDSTKKTDWTQQRSATEQVRAWPFNGQTAAASASVPSVCSDSFTVYAGGVNPASPMLVGAEPMASNPGSSIRDYFPNGVIGQTMAYDPNEGFGQPVPDSGYVDAAWLASAAKKKHAYTFLETAVKEMKDRAAQRDTQPDHTGGQPGGERSMAATVRAFNALTGKNLTEAEGWEFMILLKLVRGRQGDFRADDYIDAAAYAALLGECESTSR